MPLWTPRGVEEDPPRISFMQYAENFARPLFEGREEKSKRAMYASSDPRSEARRQDTLQGKGWTKNPTIAGEVVGGAVPGVGEAIDIAEIVQGFGKIKRREPGGFTQVGFGFGGLALPFVAAGSLKRIGQAAARNADDLEKIVAPAIRMPDGRVFKGEPGEIHADVIGRALEKGDMTREELQFLDDSGHVFETTRGNIVDRFNAKRLATASGQVTHNEQMKDLHSAEFTPAERAELPPEPEVELPPNQGRTVPEMMKLRNKRVQSIRHLDEATANDAVRRGVHLRRDSSGQYVGAPPGIDSPQKLAAFRKKLMQKVRDGQVGREWYDRAREGNREITRSLDPWRTDRLANAEGIFSQQADPNPNFTLTLQAENAFERGRPSTRVRTGDQTKKFTDMAENEVISDIGPKTGTYDTFINPNKTPPFWGVNDVWMVRAFGYGDMGNDAASASMHAFMDGEMMRLTQDLNAVAKEAGEPLWDVGQAQASIWTDAKGRGLLEKGRVKTLEEGYLEAAKTYPDYFDKNSVNVTTEGTPGAGIGHLEGVKDSPFAVRQAYSDDQGFFSDQGQDLLYAEQGMLQQDPARSMGSFFGPEGLEVNPGLNVRPLVDKVPGSSSSYVNNRKRLGVGGSGPAAESAEGFSPAMGETLNATEATRGFFGPPQNAVAYHQVIENPQLKGGMDHAFLPMDRALTKDEMIALTDIGAEHRLFPVDTGKGVTMMPDTWADGPPMDATQMLKALRGKLGEQLRGVTGTDPQRVATKGEYLKIYEDTTPGSGEATRRMLRQVNNASAPNTRPRLESPAIRERVGEIADFDDMMGQHGTYGAVREDIQRARRLFSKEGFSGLERGLKEGLALPAVGGLLFGGERFMRREDKHRESYLTRGFLGG